MGCYVVIFVGIVIPFSVVSTGKSNITITEKSSWISPQNFSTMIAESLKQSKCSNVHICGDSVAIKTIFNDFVKIYRYAYILINRSYHCNGYFVISTSANRLVTILETIPMTSSTEILIIIDNDIVQSSILFNVSMYQHANVNIATRNGLWILSENFLEPRVFKKLSRYHEMVDKRGIVNLHGRELQAAAFYQPPFCYLRSTVNRTVKGIEGEFFIANNTSELDGVEFKLFMLIAKRLNFTWIIRKPNHHYRYGRRNGTDWYGGMIGQIYRKEVDIAFTNIWFTMDRYQFANMSKPWTEGSIKFLVPRPKPRRSFWALTRPFSLKVWAATFVMLIAQSVYVYAKAWVSPKIPKRFRNFVVTLTELMGRLLGEWVSARIQGLRLQLQLWHFIGILLVTAYTSNLAARLTSTGFEKRIDTLQDFIAANLTWGREAPVPLFSNYFDLSDSYGKQFPERFELESNETERHRKILKGNYAILGNIIGKMFFPENYIRLEDFKIILRLQETGLTQYHLHDVIRRRTGREIREVFIEHDIGTRVPRILKLTPLGVGFSMLLFGLALSSAIFYLELKCASGKRSIRQVLQRIKKNRDIRDIKKISRKRGYPALKSLRGKKYGFALP